VIAETENLSQFVGVGFSSAAADLALFAGIAAYMAFVEPRIALLGAVFFVPQLAIAQLAQIRLNRLNAERVALMREAADVVLDRTSADRTALLQKISANQVRISIVSHILKSVRNLLITLPSIAALVYGGWLVIGGQTTIGTVVAFVSGFRKVSDPVRDLLEFYVYAEWARVQHRLTADWFEAQQASRMKG
jgi:ABC-type bacteriocin/lantibiotic exporter with double-glycine peptidase domain